MKDIVEYILATLVILSIIPVYNYIIDTLYSPPELRVEETVVYAFADQLIPIINEAGLYGNLSSPLIDLGELVKHRLPYFTDKYGFYVEMVSAGILYTFVSGGDVVIYTLMKGNVSIIVIDKDLAAYNMSRSDPSYVLSNGTYVYRFTLPDPSNTAYIAVVLDTNYYRYIDYCVVDANEIYIGNINGSLIMLSQNISLYTLPSNEYGLPIAITSYSHNRFQVFNKTIVYGNIVGLGSIGFGWSWWYGPYVEYSIYYNSTYMKYYGIYSNNIIVGGTSYEVVPIYLIYNCTVDEVRYRYYLWPGTMSSWVVSSSEYDMLKNPLYAPVYNIPLIYGKGASGEIYVGKWYPHRITFGETVPEGIPVTKITLLKRIGMVDYYITIYMWRRAVT